MWLRLHLLSHRLVRPHELNLTGVFGKLTNVVWTNYGPCAVEGFEATRLRLMRRGPVQVLGVDKFPRMVDYVVPSGVRIADADRVRLGAHLASGTTVMHEGFVNYNAGTLGRLDGRGPHQRRCRGRRRLGHRRRRVDHGHAVRRRHRRSSPSANAAWSGANAGIGISLGDDCVVEAGCYVTAGTKVTLQDGSVVKARELSGRDNLLFWRNSVSGAIEVVARSGSWGSLNAALHAND